MQESPIPRRSSIRFRLPLFMVAIVAVATVVYVWLAYQEYERVLMLTAHERLEANSRTIVSALSTTPAGLAGLRQLTVNPAIRAAVRNPNLTPAQQAATLARLAPPVADSSRIALWLLNREGEALGVHLRSSDVTPATWYGGDARAVLPRGTNYAISPILGLDSVPFFEVVVPVHAQDDGESLIGYIVDAREVRGRNVAAMRRILQAEVMLVGQPGAGVWTDLERVAPPPPELQMRDTAFAFTQSAYGPGVGVARTIPGLDWVVWLQTSQSAVLAPARTFVLRMVPVATTVVVVAVLLAWFFSYDLTRRILGLAARVDTIDSGVDRMTTDEMRALRRGGDEIDRLQAAFAEMSERVARQHTLEAQLAQAQKLEAVGRLAGGIAHDFNNMMTVVDTYAELVSAELPKDTQAAEDLQEVIKASQRASALTRQLLAFSGRQVLRPAPTALNDVIQAAHQMLARVIPANVIFELDLSSDVGPVLADRSQLEQVLTNLVINAADAMPTGGTLTIRTASAERPIGDNGDTRRHVCLSVRDTGVGMDEDTAARVFDPFFTTKKPGKGTGLGLATVKGVVEQLGGTVSVTSARGVGTTFELYFREIADLAPVA